MADLGLPMARPPGTDPPCHDCPKTIGMQTRHWDGAPDPTERTRKTYQHFRECSAVGKFPDDPIVRRNAMIIRTVEDSIARGRAMGVMAMFGLKG